MTAAPSLIVTRPEPEATRWTEALRARGIGAQALPLIEIAPLAGAVAWPVEQSPHVLMFVSASAVRHFFSSAPPASVNGCRCWATGSGTARALAEAGVDSARIDQPAAEGPFDSESLWARVHHQIEPGACVWLVRGADAEGRAAGRDWLFRRIEASGGVPVQVPVYRRLVPRLGVEGTRVVQAGIASGATWLFSSSEAVANLLALAPRADWSQAFALATHERIAQAARGAGFGGVRVVAPDLDAVAASIEFPR
ncbi:uroporphyrinogen-III synthase [Pseudacidovorax sp. RU35E]|uniref:uroporphyrinogen-III synthase n=1 Tax=Pseudacidovorax sp. RU35E TaxID=1907403 RepID=UPI00095448A5|nr:uroporphyrinogen-III synthase [Pseudacidovorax sp. RU35E]SIQ87058.1 uroporphyrinogen-III synthase [Pseudacidovorax sp. RU35E]